MNVILRPEVRLHDLEALPSDYRRQAVQILMALDRNPARPAGYDVVTLRPSHVALDLSGCFAIRFGGEAYEDGYRIVYRLLDGDEVEVLAIGNRQGSEVFRAAMARLYPPPMLPRQLRTHSAQDWARRA